MRRGCGWGALWLVLAMVLGGCGRDWEVATRIDRDWYRRNLEEAHLAHWLAAAPTGTGFFNTALDRHWQPVAEQPGDLVAQARTIYVMAIGHEVTAHPAYLEQVRQGTEFLLRHYRDPIHGGWYEAVAPDGTLTYTFVEALSATYPYYLGRLAGGVLVVIGMFIMAWNVYKTFQMARDAKPIPVAEPAHA